ncbi:MAG TPA: outer membrane beta-barrel family protein [Chitinophagaceae bacterium]|nr:outer membrane beta-barrel family protein [Chitinophagaceae bacterium]
MRYFLLSFVALFSFVLSVKAQKATLKGSVIDTLNKTILQNATISLLRAKDSVLIKFTRTDTKGFFELSNLPAGKAILIVSYPSYADYTDELELTENQTVVKNNIPVITKAKLLEEVIVKQKFSAIRIKGDTTEFIADSFKVRANANVQDLLKKLPGIQVNSKGEITAQGEKVEKVLVDGEEFFSDDPAVVTENLRADAVSKVQVFDKKSEQAAFTGIDDGQKTKTINLELKDDKKKGYFGKLEAGTNFDKYRSGKGLLNAFKAKRKIAAYITNDNTKFQSLNWSERRNYSSDLNTVTEFGDDGSVSITSTGDDFSFGNGFPTATSIGVLYTDKWNKDKNNLNSTYQFNDLKVNGATSSINQTILQDSSYITKSGQEFSGHKQRNRLYGAQEWTFDSTNTLKLKLDGSLLKTNSSTYLNSSTEKNKLGQNYIANTNEQSNLNEENSKNFSTDLIWKKRLKKKGRTISITSMLNNGNKESNGFLFSDINIYDLNGQLQDQLITDQKKVVNEEQLRWDTRAVYTEPLWKNTFLELNYKLGLNRNDAKRTTLEKTNNNPKYEKEIDSLSNHFLFRTTNNQGGFNFKVNLKKVNFSIGSGVGRSVYGVKILDSTVNRKIGFTNFLPSMSFRYSPKKQTNWNFRYNGSTINPTLQQINPIIDNIDPLNITIGNPDLKQSFRHNFNVGFNQYKVFKSRGIWANLNFSVTQNAITNRNTIDEKGARINQAINVNGNYNGNLWSSYSFEVISKVNLGFNFNPSISRYINFLNGQRNVTINKSLGFGISLGYWTDKWINFWVNVEAANNYSQSSINKNLTTRYWNFNSYPSLNLKLPKKFYVEMESQIHIFQKTGLFNAGQNTYFVNASVKKAFTKEEKLEVKLAANDIFNQNRGISRNISSNFISETRSNVIQRYFLLSLIYNFSKNGKPSKW